MAENILSNIENIPEEKWEKALKDKDNSLSHRYNAIESDASEYLNEFVQAVKYMYKDKLSTLYIGRYGKEDHIDVHNDAAYKDFLIDDKEVLHSRKVAFIYYLTKDWN